MTFRRWRLLGVLLILAAVIIMAAAYWNLPDARTCATINSVNQNLGGPATCSSSPPAAVLVLAGVLGAAGLLILVNARKRPAR